MYRILMTWFWFFLIFFIGIILSLGYISQTINKNCLEKENTIELFLERE
ncbi:hypothetical protein [Salinimicrobium soli]